MDEAEPADETLSREECLALLASCSVGRVGLSIDALPVILPVNYVLDGERIVFRTGRGTKLTAAIRNAVVCFEVDRIDEECRAGWSVLVTGTATELVGPEAEAAARLHLTQWSRRPAEHLVATSMDLVTGRRVGPVLLDASQSGADQRTRVPTPPGPGPISKRPPTDSARDVMLRTP